MQTAKTMVRLGGVFAGLTGHFVGFVMLRLKMRWVTAKNNKMTCTHVSSKD